MADKGPSALTAGSAPDGTEKVAVIQGGNSRRLTLAQILAIVHAHTIANITGLQAALDAKLDDSQAGAGGLAVLLAANAAAVRVAAGLVIGTDVQAYDAELAALAGLTSAADKVPYFTGSGAAAVADLTSVARALIAQTTQALMRTTGLGMSANGSSFVSAADYAAMKVLLAYGTIAAYDEATVAQIRAGTASKAVSAANLIAAAAPQSLTAGATIAWDMSLGFNAKVTLAGAANAFSAPTNSVEGLTYRLELIQDGTGSRTGTFNAAFDFGSAGTPTLSTGASKHDFIYLDCYDASTPKFRTSFNKAA